jgi:hypothetical protein
MEKRTSCKEYEQDLVLYYYGECEEERGKTISEHLNGCAGCAALLADLRKVLPATVKVDDPPGSFWQDYSREMRQKIAATEDPSPWWKRVLQAFTASPLPAVSMAAALLLAIALTFNGIRRPAEEIRLEDTELPEIAAMGQSLEFFKAMDLLDSMDLLEVMEGPGDGAA